MNSTIEGRYPDQIDPDGNLIYEGHDVPKSPSNPNPKTIDQQLVNKDGSPTRNGLFFEAAMAYKRGQREPEVIQVYAKESKNSWLDKGRFLLIDARQESRNGRIVYKFVLRSINAPTSRENADSIQGFQIAKFQQEDKHDFAPIIASYLEEKFDTKLEHIKRNTLRTSSGAIIHTKKSSEGIGWYGLDTNIYNEFIQLSPVVFLVLSLDGPEKTYVLPKEKLLELFQDDKAKPRPGRTQPRWMIRIKKDASGNELLRIDHSEKSLKLNSFMNRWSQVQDFQQIDLSRMTEEKIVRAIKSEDVETLSQVLTGERTTMRLHRIGQSALRREVLKLYSYQCALCDVQDDYMLIASHIVPWSKNKELRGILQNVICLCRFHDGLFENGKLIITSDYSVKFAKSFLEKTRDSKVYELFRGLTYSKLRLPGLNPPKTELLESHRSSHVNESYD